MHHTQRSTSRSTAHENALARRYRDRGRDTTKLLVDFKEVDRQIVREGVLIGHGEHENTFQPIISVHY